MFHTKIIRFKCHRFPAVLKLGFRRNYVCKNHRYNNNNINQFNYSNKNNNKLFCFENTIAKLQRRTLSSKGFNALSNNITPPVSRHKHNIIKIVGIGALFLKLLDNFIDENDEIPDITLEFGYLDDITVANWILDDVQKNLPEKITT